jgi:rod shape-determining protein MreD
MSPRKWLACSMLLFLLLIIQIVAVDGLALPLGYPDIVLTGLLCLGLCTGPLQGMVLGFATGLTIDLFSDHAAGRLALVYCFVGFFAGLGADESERSALVPLATVGAGSAAAVIGYAITGLFTGDARVGPAHVPSLLAARVLYDVVLTPIVYPMARGLLRKLDPVRI